MRVLRRVDSLHRYAGCISRLAAVFNLPTLTTDRLLLRRFDLADAPEIQILASDARIAAYTLTIPHPYPEGAALEFINRTHERAAQGIAIQLAVTLKADQAVIGSVNLRPHLLKQSAEIGYWVGVPYWGQGYITEAASAIIQYAFHVLDLRRVYAKHLTDNAASGRVMQKAGMTHEGTMRQHVYKNGSFHDVAYYSILRTE